MKNTLLALAMAAGLLAPSFAPALAQEGPRRGTLIMASGPAVYWYSDVTARRYVFPNMKTFYTWFQPTDFSHVHRVSDAELASLVIGGNMTYRPGARLIKIPTDPKVYAVEGGSLRWIESEDVAAALYGPHWQQYIDDVPDAFLPNYSVASSIATPSDYRPGNLLTPDDLVRATVRR